MEYAAMAKVAVLNCLDALFTDFVYGLKQCISL
jgi:hypothetical protein